MGIGFTTPICFKDNNRTWHQALSEEIDNYLFLGGIRAHVINAKEAVLRATYIPCYVQALKIFSYITLILPALAFVAKAILRAGYQFKIIDPKLEGVTITEQTAKKVQQAVAQKFKGTNLLQGRNTVFKLPDVPGLVFKITFTSDPHKRYQNMVQGEKIRQIHQLWNLVIPKASLFDVECNGVKTTVIAEEELDINPDDSVQEQIWADHADDLNEAIRQHARFTMLTGHDDNERRNSPAIKKNGKYSHIGLVDFDSVGKAEDGIYGCISSGLLRCVFSDQNIEAVMSEATRGGLRYKREAVERRKKDVQEYWKLRAFHREKGLDNHPRQPIKIDDLNALGLDLNASQEVKEYDEWDGEMITRTITLKEVLLKVIEEINKQIEKADAQKSTKGIRFIQLNTHCPPFQFYAGLGTDKWFLNEEDQAKLWLNQIANALIKKGYIYSQRGDGTIIQA